MNRGMFFMLDVFHPAIHQWPDLLWFQAAIHQWAKTITEEIDCSLVGMKLVVFLEKRTPVRIHDVFLKCYHPVSASKLK